MVDEELVSAVIGTADQAKCRCRVQILMSTSSPNALVRDSGGGVETKKHRLDLDAEQAVSGRGKPDGDQRREEHERPDQGSRETLAKSHGASRRRFSCQIQTARSLRLSKGNGR